MILSRNRGKRGLQNFIQTTQLVMQYRLGYPISVKKLPLDYPKCLLRKRESSKNYLKGCDSLLLHKSYHIHLYQLLLSINKISLLYYKGNLMKAYLAPVVELPNNQLLNQYSNNFDNCLKGAPYMPVETGRVIRLAG